MVESEVTKSQAELVEEGFIVKPILPNIENDFANTTSRVENDVTASLSNNDEGWITTSPKHHHPRKHQRKRNRTLSSGDNQGTKATPFLNNISSNAGLENHQSHLRGSRSHSFSRRSEDTNFPKAETNFISNSIVVVVDNSNVFIGARETVCIAHSQQIKPKHVKLRLQQLLSVAESGRKVTRGFTAGSSPPASEQVWDVYR